MSYFYTTLSTEDDDTEGFARLRDPLVYDSERLKKLIVVPRGFETDFASVPRLPFVYLATGNTARRAAVIHDYLYRNPEICSRSDADAVFEEAMEVSGQPWWRRKLMWAGVRLFGWTAYSKESANEIPDSDRSSGA